MTELAPAVERLIDLALDEDVGAGDVTTEACVAADARGRAVLLAKEPFVLAGGAVFARVFQRVDAEVQVELRFADGDQIEVGAEVAVVRGPLRAILVAERVALNFLMRLSGIASGVRDMRALIAAYPGVALLDTRKTTPGLRALEKAAVRAGGGTNHRHGLFDGVLIKDNHIAAAGGVAEAIQRARAHCHHLLRVQCEVSSSDQIAEALDAGAGALLLDNMDEPTLKRAVEQARALRADVFLEASGNMTAARLPRVAACGVDAISVGALTHGARAVDVSLMVAAAALE